MEEKGAGWKLKTGARSSISHQAGLLAEVLSEEGSERGT